MAVSTSSTYLGVTQSKPPTISVDLRNLNASWSGGRCTVYWYSIPKGSYGDPWVDVPLNANISKYTGRGLSYIFNGSTSSTQGTHSITGLTPYETYIIAAKILPDNNSYSAEIHYATVTIGGFSTANTGVEATGKTSNSLTVRLKGLNTSWGGGSCPVYWYTAPKTSSTSPISGWISRGYTNIFNGSTSAAQGEQVITGLSSDTTYWIKAEVTYGSIKKTYTNYATTTEEENGGDDTGDGEEEIQNPIISFTVQQRGYSDTTYNQGLVLIDSNINLSGISFYLTDVTTGTFYNLELDWVENGEGDDIYYSASCYFRPVNTLETHIFELNYTYIINWTLSTQATFEEPYDLRISNLEITHGYKKLIFKCMPAPETRGTINYSVQYQTNSGGWWYFGNAYTNSVVTVANKPFGMSYHIRMQAGLKSVYGEALEADVTVPPAPPTISVSVDGSKINISYGVIDSTYIDEFIFTLYTTTGQEVAEKSVAINSTEMVTPIGTTSFTVAAKGSYYVRVQTVRNGVACFISADSDIRYIQSEAITITSSLLDLWDWEINKGSDRDSAYQALTNNGNVRDFKYTVWNELCAKVKEALESESGGQWDDIFASYEDTLMFDTEVGRKLTALRFNSLRRNVGNKESTGVGDKIPGNDVIGEEFIDITNALNTFINKLKLNNNI